MQRTTMASGVALAILLGAFTSSAADEEFLSDYSKLQPVKGDENEKTWAVADAETRALKYKSVMIDQPEIFISPDVEVQRREAGRSQGPCG